MIRRSVELKRIEVGAAQSSEAFGVVPSDELQLVFTGSDVEQVDRFPSPDAEEVGGRSGRFESYPFESFNLERV